MASEAWHRRDDQRHEQAGDRPARELVPEIQPLRQAAHPQQHEDHDKGRCRERGKPVRRATDPLGELRQREQEKDQPVVEVVGQGKGAEIDERARRGTR